MCERFHCLPSQLYEEDAELMRMLAIRAMGTKNKAGEGEFDG